MIVILLINITNAISLSFTWVDYVLIDENYVPLAIGFSLWIVVDIFLYYAATSDPGLIPK